MNRYMIAIGSPECLHMGLHRLEQVPSDVERMCEFFTSEIQGYKRVLADEIPPGAPSRTIRDQLVRWFSDPSRQETDCVVIYYAGHADTFGKFKDHYLYTSDSKPREIQNTAIKTASLPEILFEGEGLRPQSVLLILDTCHAGAGGGQASAALSVASEALGGLGAGFWLLASSGPDDIAGDGSFVHAFLAAVKDPSIFGAGAAEYLNPIEIAAVVNEQFAANGRGQRAEGNSIRGGRSPHEFVRNSPYRPDLAGSVLEDLRHWDEKARGVDSSVDRRDYFVGRKAALASLREWFNAKSSGSQARVVTGGPGSGKSAVLGRLLLDLRGDSQRSGCIAAIHAHGLSLPVIVDSLAGQLGVRAPGLAALLQHVAEPGSPIVIVFDALDEAAAPRQTEDQLLVPLAAASRVWLLVGTRVDRNCRVPLGAAALEVNLDSPDYFREEDIAAYVFKRLTQSDSVSFFAPAQEHGKAKELAAAVARAAVHSFLYARVVSRWLAHAGAAIDTTLPNWVERIRMPKDVPDAFGRDLERFDSAIRRLVVDLLTPLAYSQGKGLPQKTIWCEIASALAGRTYTNADIRDLKQAAGFYLVRDVEDNENVYRLFHEAFAEYLRDLTKDEDAHGIICDSLLRHAAREYGGKLRWAKVREPYILSYVAVHAALAGKLEGLLDADFLIHVNPKTFLKPLEDVNRGALMSVVDAYRRAYPWMNSADTSVRIQYLALGAVLFGAADLFAQLQEVRTNCRWFPFRAWYRDLGAHVIASGIAADAACLVTSPDGIPKLVLVSRYYVQMFNISTGEKLRERDWPFDDVCSRVMEIPDTKNVLVATASRVGAIRVLNLTEGKLGVSESGPSEPHLCVLSGKQRPILAVGGDDGKVHLWALPDLSPLRDFVAHKARIAFLGRCEIDGKEALITGSGAYRNGRVVESTQVRVWNVEKQEPFREIRGPEGYDAEWSALIHLDAESYLLTYFNPSGRFFLHHVPSGNLVTATNDSITARMFGVVTEPRSTTLLSGYSGEFRVIRVSGQDDSGAVSIVPSAGLNIKAGEWLGPARVRDRTVVISVGDDVKAWDLSQLLAKTNETVQLAVGQVHADGEPLYCLSAPASGRCFAGVSRLGNLRIWSYEGELIRIEQLVTTLSASAQVFVQMIDFEGRPLCLVVNNRNVQCRLLDGTLALPPTNLGFPIESVLAVELEQRLQLLAVVQEASEYEIRLWDVLSGQEVDSKEKRKRSVDFPFQFSGYEDKAIQQMVVVKEGQFNILVAASSTPYNLVRAWNLESKKEAWQSNMAEAVTSLIPVVTNKGKVVVGADNKGNIRIWRAGDGEVLASWRSSQRGITQLCSGPSGGREIIVSASRDGTIMGWDGIGSCVFEINTGDSITSLAPLADRRLAVGTERGFILFQLRTE
jgi:WD40 repeat protein